MSEKLFIIDTNLLVSIVIRLNGLPEKMLHRVLEIGKLCFSNFTKNELEQVLTRDKFEKYSSRKERISKMERLFNQAFFVETVADSISVCRDSKDDIFLELATTVKAECIITGDLDLLELHPFRGIQILTASGFLDLYGG